MQLHHGDIEGDRRMRAGSTLRDTSWKQLSWSQEHGDEMEKTDEKVVMKTWGAHSG